MSVPIIGQPSIEDVVVLASFLLTCPCGHKMLFLGAKGTTRSCSKCPRAFLLKADPVPHHDGSFDIRLEMGIRGPERPPDS